MRKIGTKTAAKRKTTRSRPRSIQRAWFKKWRFAAIVTICLILGMTFGYALNQSQLQNQNSSANFAIQGLDISHHQKEIDWPTVKASHYQFVFIKATEGGDFKDPRFLVNWLQAREQQFKVGAYHFYRSCISPEIQAKNYIESVPKAEDSLPPVIDLEFTGNCPTQKSTAQVRADIQTLIDKFEQHYQKRVILYVSDVFYQYYIANHFEKQPLWLRNLEQAPSTPDQRPWILWQFSHQGQVNGIKTDVDLNLFNGNAKEFTALYKKKI